MNRRTARIREDTRQRVLDTAGRLGYLPNRLAQGLQSRKARMLGILMPNLSRAFADVYFGEAISAIHECAAAAGYKILLEVANEQFVAEGQHRQLIDRCFVDGTLCLGVKDSDEYLRDFADGKRPAIVVNNYIPGMDLNFVRCDYEAAGRLACEYLLRAGHREIGLIHGAGNVQTSVDFRRGAEAVLAERGVPLTPNRIADGFLTERGGADAAERLVRGNPTMTALVCGNDKIAIGAISRLKAIGVRVPWEISVIGCDDIPQGEYTDPGLTTIATPIFEIGRRACECLIELIEGRGAGVQEVLSVSLRVRSSVVPAAPWN